MLNGNGSRERLVWIAVVVALATAASWLGAVSLMLVLRESGFTLPPEIPVAGRALVRAARLLIRQAAPAAMIALFITGMAGLLALSARRSEPPVREGARHV